MHIHDFLQDQAVLNFMFHQYKYKSFLESHTTIHLPMFPCLFTEVPLLSTDSKHMVLSRHQINAYLVLSPAGISDGKRMKASGSSYLHATPFPKHFLPFSFLSGIPYLQA